MLIRMVDVMSMGVLEIFNMLELRLEVVLLRRISVVIEVVVVSVEMMMLMFVVRFIWCLIGVFRVLLIREMYRRVMMRLMRFWIVVEMIEIVWMVLLLGVEVVRIVCRIMKVVVVKMVVRLMVRGSNDCIVFRIWIGIVEMVFLWGWNVGDVLLCCLLGLRCF